MTLRLLIAFVLFLAGAIAVEAQAPAPATPENLVTAAKRAAGTDYAGTFVRICVAPENLGAGAPRGGGPGVRAVPDRAQWYAPPYRVFDNLYFVGTKIHSAWALTTSDGIIIIDTLFDYAIEPEIIDGLSTLGLDPRTVKYVLISHAHGDHDQGAALLQRRGAKVVMGAADWEATLQRPATAPGGVPTRDIAVGPEGLKLRLGDTLVDVVATPGHTPGTLSYVFPVKDRGRSLVVAYSGGTAFNFPRRPENFAVYRDTQRKMLELAGAAGATVLMTNHTEFDRAYDRARLAQLPRAAGEKHPYETDTATVQRYFEMSRDCAEAQRLSIK
jgi:metallo-beta-lactamase class B